MVRGIATVPAPHLSAGFRVEGTPLWRERKNRGMLSTERRRDG